MESQDPDDWQLPLSQLSVDPYQLLTSRRRAQYEVEPSERCVPTQTEAGIRQFALPVLQLENKALVILLEFEPTLFGSYQMVFEGCFENDAETSKTLLWTSNVFKDVQNDMFSHVSIFGQT